MTINCFNFNNGKTYDINLVPKFNVETIFTELAKGFAR